MERPTRRELLSTSAKATLAAGLAVGTASTAGAIEPIKRTGGPLLKVGCCAYSYRQYLQAKTSPITLYDFLDTCAALNLDGVELTSYYFPTPVTLAEINKLTRHAFLLGLEVAGTAVGNNFCLPPGPERDKQIALVKQWLVYAADMGARQMRIFAGNVPKDTDPMTGRKWVVECIEQCLPEAEARGVMLAMENHHGVVTDAEGVLDILNAVKSDWLGMKWDCGNFRTADPYADLTRCAPFAVTTHIKTDMFPNDKRTDTDLPKIVKILREAGYRGYLLLEYESQEEPKVAVPRILANLRRLTSNE